jgi:hypothetical protein
MKAQAWAERGNRHMTLGEFMYAPERNAYVEHPEFESLYVRKAKRWLEGQWHDTLDVGNVVAKVRGQGAWGRLVEELQAIAPHKTIFVESVVNERFARRLEREQFTRHPTAEPPCFYLKPRMR